MNVVIACPTCQQKIRAPKAMIGRSVKCPQCRNLFTALDAAEVGLAEPSPKSSRPAIPEGQAVYPEPPAPTIHAETLWNESERSDDAKPPAVNSLVEYLLFRRMVTPAIVVMLFYVGIVLQLTGGAFLFVSGLLQLIARSGVAAGVGFMAAGLFGTTISIVAWRIFCEVLLTLFRILEQLREFNEKQGVP
jgi:hypothetical protein